MNKITIFIIGFIVGVLCSAILCKKSHSCITEIEYIFHTDTITIKDTIKDTLIIPNKIYVDRIETVLMKSKGDTIFIDVDVPIERKEYITSSYKAIIEGFKASLIDIETYSETKYITNTEKITVVQKKKPNWGIGLQLGYGISNTKTSPYIGVGLQYNFLTF